MSTVESASASAAPSAPRIADRVSRWSQLFGQWKTTPYVVLLCAVFLMLAGLVTTLHEEQLYRAQKLQEITVQGQILAASVEAALAFDDRAAAQEYVTALAVNPELEAAGVYDENGTIFAGYTRRGSPALPGRVALQDPAFGDNRLNITLPIGGADGIVGTVYVRAVTDSLQRRITRYTGIMLLTVMAALMLTVLGIAHYTLSSMIRELRLQAEDLSGANQLLLAEIAERERAEDALRQSHKMEALGQLSGGIAHDFNNLLTVIKGNLQLMQRRLSMGQADVKKYTDSASDAVDRAASLTQRILAFSRRQPLSPRTVDLSRLVANMGILLHHSVGDTIEIESRLDAFWTTLCDANQMENVILNLAINARDAMPGGGKLKIETDNIRLDAPPDGSEDMPAGHYVRLIIADNGVGMSEEVRSKAIDPFFTTKPAGHGTGLGLSMTFGYIRQSNGFMTIASEVNKGTTITIWMPRHPSAETAPATAKTKHA